jgi:hypothetical protein
MVIWSLSMPPNAAFKFGLLKGGAKPGEVSHLPGEQRFRKFRHLEQLDDVRAAVTDWRVGAVGFPHHDQITAGLFENGP